MKIVQIIPSQWRGHQGQLQTSVLGLGDDNQMYRWSREKLRWDLWKSEAKSR